MTSPGPGQGVSCIFWRRTHCHCVFLGCLDVRDLQRARGVSLPGGQAQPHGRGDSWAVAAVRSHNPITRSQFHIMSPDTSTLLTLAWLVSNIATVVKVKMLLTSRFAFVQVFLMSLTLCDNFSEKTNRSKLETFWSRRKHRIEAQSLGDFGK